MYSTTGLEDSCDLMRSMTSIQTSIKAEDDSGRGLATPLARPVHDLGSLLLRQARPLTDFIDGAAAANADVPCIEYTDLDTGRSNAGRWGRRRHDGRG